MNFLQITKRRFFAASGGVSLALLIACALTTAPKAEEPVKLSLRNNGETISIDRNQSLIIQLPVESGTNASWDLGAAPTGPLRLSEEQLDAPAQIQPGVIVLQSFEFLPTGSGRGSIRLSYLQPWKRNAGLTQTYAVNVIVK